MAAVYVNNLVINAGSDFSQSFTLEGSDTNSAYNLTGFVVSSQMRKYAGSSSSIGFGTTIVSPPNLGKIIVSLASTQTSVLKPGRYVYDILIEKDNVKTRVVEGMVLVREGVTR